MGRQRNNSQMKEKEETSERMLNEIEASQLSDTEFKAMVIRKLTELTENNQKLRKTIMNSLQNYINMKKEGQKGRRNSGGKEESKKIVFWCL